MYSVIVWSLMAVLAGRFTSAQTSCSIFGPEDPTECLARVAAEVYDSRRNLGITRRVTSPTGKDIVCQAYDLEDADLDDPGLLAESGHNWILTANGRIELGGPRLEPGRHTRVDVLRRMNRSPVCNGTAEVPSEFR